MKLPRIALFCVLLLSVPVWAAEPFYGIWKMRPAKSAGNLSQTMTVEPVVEGTKVTTVIDFGNGTGMTMTYVTKFDGAEVPVYSAGKVVMTLRGKRTGPYTYEGSASGPGGTGTYKTVVSTDGKTVTTDSTTGSNPGRSVFDRVK